MDEFDLKREVTDKYSLRGRVFSKIRDDILSGRYKEHEELKENYLGEAENMAHYHHEKWDGSGYPCGLKGEEIPLSARIMSVADVFDALVAERVYKPAMPFEKALSIVKESSGKSFDPNVVEAFLHAEEKIRKVTSEIH